MSWWPWVSRGRYEEAKERIDDLKEENAELRERVMGGGKKKAEERASPRDQQKMPREIREIIGGLDSPGIRRQAKREVWRLRKKEGLKWEEVKTQLELAVQGKTARNSGRRGVTSSGSS